MRVLTIRFTSASPKQFVDFWSPCYKDPNEMLYSDSVGQPLTPDRVWNLYLWKNGGQWLAEPKRRSVEQNVIGRLEELGQLDKAYAPLDFLTRLGGVGPVWSIFLLHIWQPATYPIYDQHTCRAMRFIQVSRIEKAPSNRRLVARTYVDDSIPFFNRFPRMPDRRVDKALFAFGKFLKSPPGQRAGFVDAGQEA